MEFYPEKSYKNLKAMGILKTSEVLKHLGISQPTLSRWVNSRHITRIYRGLYMHPETIIPPEELDFAIAHTKFGSQSFIGGPSALFYYNLIEQVPKLIWIVVPSWRKDESPKSKYRCLRTKASMAVGVHQKKIFRISTIERSLIESMKFSSKIGLQTVMSAVRKSLEEELTNNVKLLEVAKALKMEKILRNHWETIIS